MNKIYSKIIHSYMFSIIISISFVFITSILSFISNTKIPGLIGLALCIALSLHIFLVRRTKKAELNDYLGSISDDITGANIISALPLPAIVLSIEGMIMWYNDKFRDAFGDNNFDISIDNVISDIRWSDILKSQNGIESDIHFNDLHYKVTGDLIRNDENEIYCVVLYFHECTYQEALEKKYNDEKIDLAIINIDNYDEMIQKIDERYRQKIIVDIDKCVNDWVAESGGLRRRTDRDRYLILFEHKYLQHYIDKKFDVVDKIRAIGENINNSITISIGVGVGGTVVQNDEYARAAIDMALGRGGDQAAIKDSEHFSFYGGNSKEYEKSTRVKTRFFTFALKDYIKRADKVVLMGHKTPDYDSFGAMMGIQRAVRALGKTPYIILDNTVSIQKLLSEAKNFEEYNDLFIDADYAMEIATPNTLVIIVDTNRPALVACEEILEKVTNKVLIDHHRRSTDSISSASLVYHEPYVSSTCEMVTEIMQYMDDNSRINTFEAKALYVGILMDTKNFVMKTGVRTFDAASYLRRYGVEPNIVKPIFNMDKADYDHKVDIVKASETYRDNIAISVCYDNFPNIRIVAAQAADEMLTIDNVRGAFVIFEDDGAIGISGRSFDKFNVQVILEKLGGGGHMTIAGARITEETSIDDIKERLTNAIDEYLEENKAD